MIDKYKYYCLSKKSWLIYIIKFLYKMSQDFWTHSMFCEISIRLVTGWRVVLWKRTVGRHWNPRFESRRGKASCTGLVPATSLNMSLRRHDSTWCGALRPAVTSCRLTRHCSVRVSLPARKTALAKKVSITEPE